MAFDDLLDPDTFMFFGADPAHTPEREHDGLGRRASRADRAVHAPREDCPRCGGARLAPNGKVIANAAADPVRLAECHVDLRGRYHARPLATVCGACGRTPYEGFGRLNRAVKPDDDRQREGYDLPSAETDEDDRTGAAVAASKNPRQAPAPAGPEGRPLTRKERRAIQYGHKAPKNP